MAISLSDENYALNNRELEERRLSLGSKPVRLSIVLTTKCNLNCIMCTRERAGKELDGRCLSKIRELLPYLRTIGWQGGEVFYHEGFKETFRDIAGNFENVRQEIITNGLLIDRVWAGYIADANVSLGVSIDAAEKRLYEHIRKGADFNDLTRSLEELAGAAKKPGGRSRRYMNVVIMKSNYRTLPDLLEFARRYSFNGVHITPVYGEKGGENIFINADRGEMEYLIGAMAALKENAAVYGISVSDQLTGTCESLLEKSAQKPIGEKGRPRGTGALNGGTGGLFCAHPWRELVVHAAKDGGIFPDCACQIPVGNIYSDGLLDAWNGEKMREYRKRMSSREVSGWCNKDCVEGMINPLTNYNY